MRAPIPNRSSDRGRAAPLQRRRRRGRRGSHLYVEPRMPERWDYGIIAVTVVSLAIVGVDAYYELPAPYAAWVSWADNFVCLIFVIDFAARLRLAPRRLEFVRRNWIDLLGAIPMIEPLRGVRIVQFIRILRLTRLATVWRLVTRRYDVQLPTGALTGIGVITVLMWLASATVFYQLEHGVNESIATFPDALWWSMTTLSTVGYGDLFPATNAGRLVAGGTMVLGIGLLGAVAATLASAFVDLKDRGRRGLRKYLMRDHLLVLGWNEKAPAAIHNFLNDARHAATDVVVIAPLESAPLEDPRVRFVRGAPGKATTLARASAETAGAAIVMASDPSDARSDHESALIVAALRRLNADVRIGVELVDSDNEEHLHHAGCDA